ncbi:hypothetical protein Sipo8835_01040 [Streptomyces ipomoeae]|jgi:hypothetical protein|uniref:DUF8175 domain-containing protein n=2 Tax=Streptomyces ipomoeae TaxID=103232 RepID=L1KVQ5_9ACTN|nr:hypothetical protein [Streptomyces ipomoeae]EKX64458.1 hypothetical protein STRIP9103_04428 [Streptomyces ipomoeae 91-03]MDX2700564.1 hypothetical protein [Streptomyces ipomoeae]MDX2824796.1 hypothetical protein [Streptomyces ipomoeae]MDX2846209.1 hypothetical protein [Streptomyces ipomoeae]MDX2880748.1 hypothetical protein [Streptomyces ipomoeae]
MSLGDERGYGESSRAGDDGTYGGYAGTGQTRTRLPERGTDPYGGAPRRGRSSSRSLVTIVGVVVLLIAAIAFANRGGNSGGDGSSGGDQTETAPTAASGEQPVGTKASGIPSGFAHDRQGAESAAANYAVVLVSADILKPVRRSEIVQQVIVPDKAADLEDSLNKAYSTDFLTKLGLDKNGNAPTGGTYVSRTMPVGTKVTAYSNTAATVEVWCTGVFGMAAEDTTNPVTSDWFTMTLQLRWADDDWKVDSFSRKAGPAPVNGDNRVSASDEISKAVEEYGGFTYAR